MSANFAVAVMTNPIWFIKTRMQVNDDNNISMKKQNHSTSNFRSALSCARHALTTEGATVFWRGTSAQLLLSFPSSLHFPIYEYLLRNCSDVNRSDETNKNTTSKESNSWNASFFSSVIACNLMAKTFVTILSHPLTLLRTRLQDARARLSSTTNNANRNINSNSPNLYSYHNLKDVAIGCYRNHGFFKGFWRGLGPSVMQVVPRSVVHVLLYEMFVVKALSSKY